MSDRSYTQLIIRAIPDDQVEAASKVLVQFFGTVATTAADMVADEYIEADGRLDMAEELADVLIATAPGMAFITWTDPRYEYEGTLVMYAPRLGRFQNPCNAEGNATFTEYQISGWLGLTMTDLLVKLGRPWTDALVPKVPV